VDVFKYRDYREFLGTYYAQGKASGLSYRAFAKAAGFSAPNYLKLVIEGSRNLSKEMAVRFAQACKLNPEAAQYFCLLVEFNQASSDAERNALHLELTKFARFRAAQRLDLAQKDYHSSWFIPVVRELVACPGFQENPSWIAERLHPSISSKEAEHALHVLARLDMTERDERGRLVQSTRAVTTGPQASGLYIRNYHSEMMQRAIWAMQGTAPEQRYISALTLSVGDTTFAEVRRRILEFRRELAALCDADPSPTRIVQLNLQLFPMTTSLGETAQ
jgi:uncharacterized protein (TIGR02147 family)